MTRRALLHLPYAALDHRPDSQPSTHVAEIDGRSTELKRQAARRDPNPFNACQAVDQLLGQSVAQVVLVACRAQVGKREHRDRRRGRRRLRSGFARRSWRRRQRRSQAEHQIASRLKPIAGRFHQAAPDQTLECRAVDRRDRGRRVADRGRRGRDGAFSAERVPAADRLVEHDTDGEQIGPLVYWLALQLFRRHVGQRSRDPPRRGTVHRRRVVSAERVNLELRQTKVEDLHHAALRDEQIRRLDVPMHGCPRRAPRPALARAGWRCQRPRRSPEVPARCAA